MASYTRGDGVRDLFIALLVSILLIMMLTSCRSTVPVIKTETKYVDREVLRDTTVYIYDSSGFAAWLECDSLGAVKIRELDSYYAGRLAAVPKVQIKDNYITVKSKIDSAAVYFALKDRYIEKVETKTVTVEVNRITGWQWAQIWAGRLFLVLVLIVAVWRYVRRKLP